MASHVPTSIATHKQKVCSLYKRAIRCLESWYCDRLVFRYQAVLMRDQFDQNKAVTDHSKLAKLIQDGEQQLFDKQHYQPKMWPKTIGGNAYGRQAHCPDWVLDYWHPLEKAQYPEYFARREKRKEEFIRLWEKEYSKTPQSS